MYRFIEDPGHGWLEVPRSELRELGILDTISPYSFQAGEMVFLEEDCDAPRFSDAYKAEYGEAPDYTTFFEDPTEIRSYSRFSN